MWIELAIASALLLGAYDFFKNISLNKNSVLMVLTVTTALSALFTLPFLVTGYEPFAAGSFVPWQGEWRLVFKAVLVTLSWLTGLAALKYLPLTTAGTLKAMRPVLVVLFSVLFMGERLNGWQTVGVLAAFAAFFLLSAASSREGIRFTHSKGVLYMAVSVLSGVGSALWDKLIMRAMPPIYVLSHTNLYIALLMLVLFGALRLWTRTAVAKEASFSQSASASAPEAASDTASALLARDASQPFIFDVNLLLISLFISGADFFYYLALQQEGALLSIISVSRRLSVVVTFVLGAVFLRERNIGRKALALGLLLAALLLILFGSHTVFLSAVQNFVDSF